MAWRIADDWPVWGSSPSPTCTGPVPSLTIHRRERKGWGRRRGWGLPVTTGGKLGRPFKEWLTPKTVSTRDKWTLWIKLRGARTRCPSLCHAHVVRGETSTPRLASPHLTAVSRLTPHPTWWLCPHATLKMAAAPQWWSPQRPHSNGNRGRSFSPSLRSFRRAPCLWRRRGSAGWLWPRRRKRRKALESGLGGAEVAEVDGGGGSERRWTTNSTRESAARPSPTPPCRCGGLRRPAPCRRLPAAAASAPVGREAMSHGAAHSPVPPPPEPGPALLGCCCLTLRGCGPEGWGRWSGGTTLCSWRGIPHGAPPWGGPAGRGVAGRLMAPLLAHLFWSFAGNGAGGETCGVRGAGVVSARLRGCLCYA